MPENYICKDCNYASDVAGLCPYCDMPLEPLDPTKIDPNTGTPKETEIYAKDDLKVDDPGGLPPLPNVGSDDDDDLDDEEEEEEIAQEEPIDEEEE